MIQLGIIINDQSVFMCVTDNLGRVVHWKILDGRDETLSN